MPIKTFKVRYVAEVEETIYIDTDYSGSAIKRELYDQTREISEFRSTSGTTIQPIAVSSVEIGPEYTKEQWEILPELDMW